MTWRVKYKYEWEDVWKHPKLEFNTQGKARRWLKAHRYKMTRGVIIHPDGLLELAIFNKDRL